METVLLHVILVHIACIDAAMRSRLERRREEGTRITVLLVPVLKGLRKLRKRTRELIWETVYQKSTATTLECPGFPSITSVSMTASTFRKDLPGGIIAANDCIDRASVANSPML